MMTTTMLFRCQETGEPVTICTTKEMIASASKYRTVLVTRSIRYAAKRDAEPAYWPCALTHWLGRVRTLTVEPPGPAARVVPAAPAPCAAAGGSPSGRCAGPARRPRYASYPVLGSLVRRSTWR